MSRKYTRCLKCSNNIIKGDIVCKSNTLIDVNVKGNIYSYSDHDIYIMGEVEGNIETQGKVEIFAYAKVVGNITCDSIVADRGCTIEGVIKTSEFKKSESKNKSKNNYVASGMVD